MNTFNIDKLTKLVENGPDKWPGAKSIHKKNGNIKITILENNQETINLEIGDIVNRHILDNDYVLFNRQPSHINGMTGHRVKVGCLPFDQILV